MDYTDRLNNILEEHKVKIGDVIRIEKDSQIFEGTIMPNTGDPDTLVMKLKSGYNIGVHIDGAKIKKLEKEEKEKTVRKVRHEHDDGKKTILILHTGGTIASKIDYETGAVHAAFTPEEIISSIPDLQDVANVKAEMVFQMWSEDMEPEHWEILAKKVAEEHSRFDGIIITHGTDMMHYTAAALSFMLSGIDKPVILVGSQRSSDRGSSDASMNLMCAAQFIVKSDFRGVAVCMHGSMDDEFCYIHNGLHVRKMHSSRRDAFKSVDIPPIAKVTRNGHVEMIEHENFSGSFKPIFGFEKKVAIVKMRPGFDYRELEFYEKVGYKGIIIEGSGLGHAPINVLDSYTKHHAQLYETIRRMSKEMIVAMTTQCIFGKVNLNVYSTGRRLTEAGVIPVAMTPETAFVKLGWVLGHTNCLTEARRLFTENLVGEMVDRIDPRAYIK